MLRIVFLIGLKKESITASTVLYHLIFTYTKSIVTKKRIEGAQQ